nr:hypothetical protein [Tanacetum cinerariifolium]
MVKSSSSSKNEVFDDSFCSTSCKKNTESLNTKIIKLSEKLSDNQERERRFRLPTHRLESAAKDLDTLIESQRSDKNKKGLGYSDVPPSCSKSNSNDLQNNNSTISEHGESSESIMYKPIIKFVKAADSPGVIKTNKTETARKPPVKYAEMYRNTSKSPKVRENQRNWNNLMNQRLGRKNWLKNNFAHKKVTPRADLFKTASKVMRLERELKARTPPIKIHKVDVRGRSRSVMAWVPKKKMVKSSSSSKNEVFDDSFSSTSCKKDTESLNTKITKLSEKLTDIYSPSKKDMSWIGLPEFADDTITDYSGHSPIIESNSSDLQNNNSTVFKHGESSESIMSKPMIKFVKAADSPGVIKTNKIETARKPPVKYAEMYRNTSKSPKVRGNQRNWNNLMNHRLGRKNWLKNNFAHKKVTPRADLFKKHQLKVMRLERELKARTPPTKICKVDVRGRSRCNIKFRGGLLGIKCSKSFPLPVIKIPLLEYFATVSAIKCSKAFPLLVPLLVHFPTIQPSWEQQVVLELVEKR